jgi:hypothetical protein
MGQRCLTLDGTNAISIHTGYDFAECTQVCEPVTTIQPWEVAARFSLARRPVSAGL